MKRGLQRWGARCRGSFATLTVALLITHFAAALAADRPRFRHNVPEPVLESSTGGNRAAPTGLNGVTAIPNGGYQTEPVGIRYSSLFRNTRFPSGNPVTLPPVEPTARSGQFRANVRVDVPALGGGLPFLDRGFEPENADLKIGPVYFKLQSLQGAILHSDNINLEPGNERESGTIAIVGLNIGIIAQLTEGLRFATSGSFVYLPLQGEAGVAGFGLPYLYDLNFYTGPSTRAQVVWDTNIGGWNVVFADNFTIGLGVYSDDVRSDYALFEGADFTGQSRAGVYVFSSYGGNRYPRRNGDDNGNDFRTDTVIFSNIISAETERLLPGPMRLRARIYREDLWYNQGNRGLPGLREGGFIGLFGERENMRFKPYVTYEAFRTDTQDSFQNIFRLGLNGPITKQLTLQAEVGYYVDGNGNSGTLWRLDLQHNVGPYTQQSFYYGRSFSDFHDEIIEGFGYNLHQILGPKLRADAFISRLNYENTDQREDQFARTEWRAGLRFDYTLGPKTRAQISGIYTSTEPDQTKTWTARLDVDYNFTDTLLGRFAYQYRQSESLTSDLNYTENLFYLSLTKYFP